MAPLQLLLTISIISIQLGVVQPEDVTSLALSCPSDQFPCEDGSNCIPKSKLCNGHSTCQDLSHNVPSQCDNCAADKLFKCKKNGVDVCWNVQWKCDGHAYSTCDDNSNNFPSQCDNCAASHLFSCKKDNVDVCMNVRYKCDRVRHCDDGADELESECFQCTDGSKTVSKSFLCDGNNHCKDASDESKSLCTPPCSTDMFACADGSKCIPKSKLCNGYGDCKDNSNNFPSQCDNCAADHLFMCKRSGVNVCMNALAKCDGVKHCENSADELVSECGCSSEQFACEDGLKCIPKSKVCDDNDDCEDWSDESLFICLPPCSTDMFACADGSKCITRSKLCNGYTTCKDRSHNLPSQCDNCAADHLFKCKKSGVDFCMHTINKCDGVYQCSDLADELVSECDNCVSDPSKFTCRAEGQMVCLSKERYQCDGIYDCDNGSDEDPSTCDNCNQADRAMCRDGSLCANTKYACNGYADDCADGSDESDTWSNCTHCSKKGWVPCPGFPDICAKLCDGKATCPDKWDELISTCKSQAVTSVALTTTSEIGQVPSNEAQTAICSKEAGLHQCKDNSMCITKGEVCDVRKDCRDGSDESADACKDKCQSLKYPLLPCDNGSCIHLSNACTAQTQPLCKDGKDMAYDLCKDKCYNRFPGNEDPYRWPCKNGTKKCILQTSRCDGDQDCDDATELSYSSDEQNCHPVTRVGLNQTLLICLAIMALCWILLFMLIACTHSLEQDQSIEDNIFAPSSSDPTSSSSPSDQDLPSFLLHPALSDMDSQCQSWQEVGEQLRLEVVFFNRDPQVLFGFLYHIDAQDAHPDNIHNAFQGFFAYLKSKGYDAIAVALSMKKTIGHNRLAHMALKGPPNFMDRKLFQLGKWVSEFELRGKVYFYLVSSLRAIQASVSPFLLNLDYAKDLIMYLILKETVHRLDGNCKNLKDLGFDCLAASGTEQDLLLALLVTFCVSIILTSINSYFLRKRFFKTNFGLNFVFGFISPLLPAVYHIRLSQMRLELNKPKTKLSKDDFRRKAEQIETLSNSVQQTKEIEVGLEAVIQILLLLGLACFFPYVFKAPSGQTYSYFFGVALLVLKGNTVLFLSSILVSFLGPCMFYINRTNLLRHGSLNMSKKLVLMTRNVLFLLVRVLTITSAIFIPVIKEWAPFVGNAGVNANTFLDSQSFRIEFQNYFSKGLDALTADIRKNAQFFLLFLFIHLMLVVCHAIFYSAKFKKSKMRERVLHLISSFWLPLPFLTIRGVDRGEEKAELWFLIVLHSLENFLIVFASRLVYLQESYPLEIVIFDCVLVLLNLMGVLLSVIYVTKVELYAGLPQDLSSLPSFGPEDVLTGFENANHEEGEIVIQSQEAEAEEEPLEVGPREKTEPEST